MKNPLQKKIIIIGAGVAGLSVACRLAADGHQVTVIEKEDKVGGKLNEWSDGTYRFDTGPSLLTMPEHLTDLFSYCGKDVRDYLSIQPVSPLCRYFWEDGTCLDSYADRNLALKEINKVAPEDEKSYIHFLEYAEKLYERTQPAFLNSPLYEWVDFKSLNFVDTLRIDAFKSMEKRIDQSFKSSYLKQLFKRFATYNGSDPAQAPATLNVIAHVELNLGGHYVKGGMYAIAKAMQSLAAELGVVFRLNEQVQTFKNKVHKTRVLSGISSSSGDYEADLIFSNCDATITHTQIATDEQINRPKKQQIASVEPSCSGFVLLLGVNKKFSQLKHHNIFFSNDYQKEFKELFRSKKPLEDPTIYIANTSYSDTTHAPENHSNLFILVNAPYLTQKQQNWNDIALAYGDKIIQKLENFGLTGLSESIERRHHISPQDFYDRFMSNAGSIYGTSSNGRMSAFARPKNKSIHFDNLYLVGGSTHPGGGIPLAILSAKHAHSLFNRALDAEAEHLIRSGKLSRNQLRK